MIIPNRRIPFATLAQVLGYEAEHAGSQVLGYEPHHATVDVEDRSMASEVYGETETFADIDDPCDFSPSGQHQYGGPADCMCVFCRKASGLDR
jgi:hypothetical protein